MASSSVSQESLDMDDFDNTARRNRIRVHRGHSGRGSAPFRGLPDRTGVGVDGGDVDKDGKSDAYQGENGDHTSTNTLGLSSHSHLPGGDHESPTRSAAARLKDKRSRANHMKGKLPKDKRKLREKRRSTGVVHCMPSTESTGDSLDDDDDDEDNGLETKKNTSYNESTNSGYHHQTLYEVRHSSNPSYSPKRNKSPSDLEADLEDNQDYDSTVSHSETNLTLIGRSESYDTPPNSAGRQPGASPSSSVMGRKISGLYAGSKYSPEPRRTFQFSNTSNVNLGGSSGADSPSRNTLSSTSSSSSILSRHRELDSPRSVSGGNSTSVFGPGNTENATQQSEGTTTSSQDPASPRLTGNTSGLDSSSYPSSIQSRPVGFSVFKEANSGGGAGVGRSDKPFSSSGYMSSSRFRDHRDRDRDNDRSAGGSQGSDPVHSRVSGFHHHHHHHQSPRPFTSSVTPPSNSALVQQKNENITQLEKQLEKEREENRRLKQEMEEKDKKIAELQKSVELLNNECDGLDEDNLKLQEENKALIRAMSKLSQNP